MSEETINIDSSQENEPLFVLLQRLQAVDQSFEDIGLDGEIDLINKGKVKIDAYKYILDKLASQLWYLDQRLDEYMKAKRAVDTAQKRVKSRLLEALEANEFTKFTGHRWTVSVRKANPSVEISGTGIIDDSLKERHPDLFKTSYIPDKTAIKKALQAGEQLGWATLKESNYVSFSINREAPE